MSRNEPIDASLTNVLSALPTGKTHVSFSELRDWQECTYRHNLKYVKKINLDKPAPVLDFGTAVHASCEDFLRTRKMNSDIALDLINKSFNEKSSLEEYTDQLREQYVGEASSILRDVPIFMEETFGDWTFIDAEHLLYERVNERHNQAFKGYIDGIIKSVTNRGKEQSWVLDWKTTSWGWSREKKQDPNVARQLVYYKHNWSKKTGTPLKDIRCGFVLLKRTAKPGTHCELLKISVGDVTLERSEKIVNNMLTSVKRGIAIKNRDSCKYCPYKETEHCT